MKNAFWSNQRTYPWRRSWRYPWFIKLKCVSTMACSNQTLLASSMPFLWNYDYKLSISLKHQWSNSFLWSSVDTLSASLPIDSATNINSKIPSKLSIFQAKLFNLEKLTLLQASGFVKWVDNKWKSGVIGGIEIRTLLFYNVSTSAVSESIQRPSRCCRLSLDSHSQIARDTQYSSALQPVEIYHSMGRIQILTT